MLSLLCIQNVLVMFKAETKTVCELTCFKSCFRQKADKQKSKVTYAMRRVALFGDEGGQSEHLRANQHDKYKSNQ